MMREIERERDKERGERERERFNITLQILNTIYALHLNIYSFSKS